MANGEKDEHHTGHSEVEEIVNTVILTYFYFAILHFSDSILSWPLRTKPGIRSENRANPACKGKISVSFIKFEIHESFSICSSFTKGRWKYTNFQNYKK